MLNKPALQLIVSYLINDSDMTSLSKIQMMRFIEEASNKQLQHYIIHQEIVSNEQVNISEVAFLIPAAIVLSAVAAGRAIYDKTLSKAAMACQEMEGLKKKGCMKRFKLNGLSGKITALRREMGKCNQTLKPDKCRKLFQDNIDKVELQIKKIQSE